MWRVLGLVLVMLAAGVGLGYVVADATADPPRTVATTGPVPATSPAYPTPPAVEVLPDPDTPALEPGVAGEPIRLRTGRPGFVLLVDQPAGWRRTRQPPSSWTWTVADNPVNTYVLRVGIVAGQHVSVAVAKASRLAALEDAQANGNLSNLTIESETEDAFIATYVADDHLRVTMERYVSFDGGANAFSFAAVTGRTVDRTGLMDLLDRTTDSMAPGR